MIDFSILYIIYYAAISFDNPGNSRDVIAGVVTLVILMIVIIIVNLAFVFYWKVRQHYTE